MWRARFARRLHKWLRLATGLYVAALFALALHAASAQDEPGVTVPGVRITTREGRIYEGLLLPGPPRGDLRLKNVEGTFVIAEESIQSREEALLDLRRVYLPDEVLGILMGRIMPATPEDFDRLGTELLRVKLRERAVSAFRMAEMLRHPDASEARLHAELVKLRDRIGDLALRRTVYQAQESCLSGDYAAAVAQIGEVERTLVSLPDALELLAEVRRLRTQVEEGRGRARDEGIVEETRCIIDASLKSLAMDRGLPLAAARAQVVESLPGEVLERVRRRYNFSPEDASAHAAWERRPEETRLRHSYERASWVVLQPGAREPEGWWREASDETRYALLKGLYVEKHLLVIHSGLKSCGGCGGTGLADDAACGVCAGFKAQRVVIYR